MLILESSSVGGLGVAIRVRLMIMKASEGAYGYALGRWGEQGLDKGRMKLCAL